MAAAERRPFGGADVAAEEELAAVVLPPAGTDMEGVGAHGERNLLVS